MPYWLMSLVLLLENLLIFALALLVGQWMTRQFAARPVAFAPLAIDKMQIALTVSTLLLNTAVTVAGLWLWRKGIVQFREDLGGRALLDVCILILVMDFAMYFLHRIAHWQWLFPLLHRTHHVYENPRPLTLFALNPAEAVSFGSLWLVVIALYDVSWLGMTIYLALNVAFGIIGHLGVEPFPDFVKRAPLLSWLSTSTFHARHHQDLRHNFGFYTLIWDKLFGTLSPRYVEEFGKLPHRTT
ncbi:MAG: sterol desaturase family protein [Acidobacteria bacterium]|nr:sterol desaturase family protein [Acidobacteriota bacterium]